MSMTRAPQFPAYTIQREAGGHAYRLWTYLGDKKYGLMFQVREDEDAATAIAAVVELCSAALQKQGHGRLTIQEGGFTP